MRIAAFLRFAAGGEPEEARSADCPGVAGLRCPAAVEAAFSAGAVSIAVTVEAEAEPAAEVSAELVRTAVSDCNSRTSSSGVAYPSADGVEGRERGRGTLISTETAG